MRNDVADLERHCACNDVSIKHFVLPPGPALATYFHEVQGSKTVRYDVVPWNTRCQHSETSFTCLYHKRSSILYCILNQSSAPYNRFKSGSWRSTALLSLLEQVHGSRSSEPTVLGINGSAHNSRALNVNSSSSGCGSPSLVSRSCTNKGALWRSLVFSGVMPCRWVLGPLNPWR
jgi:hypothetical protein